MAAIAALLLAVAPVNGATAAASVLSSGLPDPGLTPGAANPAVTQRNIHQTICVAGWTVRVRPSSRFIRVMEDRQLAQYGFRDRNRGHYEEDHLISLELGGAPTDPRNLWPEPYHVTVTGPDPDLGAFTKDRFENWLKRAVCAGTLSLASAQLRITRNWVKYWRSAGRP
jgi:hypothetical protein